MCVRKREFVTAALGWILALRTSPRTLYDFLGAAWINLSGELLGFFDANTLASGARLNLSNSDSMLNSDYPRQELRHDCRSSGLNSQTCLTIGPYVLLRAAMASCWKNLNLYWPLAPRVGERLQPACPMWTKKSVAMWEKAGDLLRFSLFALRFKEFPVKPGCCKKLCRSQTWAWRDQVCLVCRVALGTCLVNGQRACPLSTRSRLER